MALLAEAETRRVLRVDFNIVIWPRFAKAIVDDDRAWAGEAWSSAPTSFFWVHAVLITAAVTLGVCVLVIGVRALRAGRGSRRTS